MASKYGQQLYGRDLYSSALAQLEGAALSFTVTPNARLTKSQVIQAALSYTILPTGRFTESEPFAGSLTIGITYNGILRDFNNFVATVSVPITMAGILFRAGEREFQGNLPVSVVPQGRFTKLWEAQATLTFQVLFDSDEYIGPFWKPDDPIEDGWVPDSVTNGPWAPIPTPPNWSG